MPSSIGRQKRFQLQYFSYTSRFSGILYLYSFPFNCDFLFLHNVADMYLTTDVSNSWGFWLQIHPDDAFGHQMIRNLEV